VDRCKEGGGDAGGTPAVENLARLLTDHPFGDAEPLLCTPDREVSAGEARARVLALAQQLDAAGVAAGQAVAVRLPTGPEIVIAMAGIWSAGAVFVPVNVRQTEREVEHILSTIRPAAIIDDAGIRPTGDAAAYAPDTAFVTWTSGTTGNPKAILQTHSGYLEILDRVLDQLRKGGEAGARPSPNLVPVPVALNAGIYNVLFGLRAGAAIVLLERFTTSAFRDVIKRYQIRSTVLPPAALVMLADDAEIIDLSPLRYLRSITAPLSPLTARRFAAKFGVTVLNGYGQAEIGEVIGWTAEDARNHPEKIGAVGRPHPGVEIKIVDERGDGAEPGQVGELLVRPPRMASGYAGGESLSDRIDDDGFVRTGDYARCDADGFVWIEGRVSDLINRGGNKVFPDSVEEVLRLSPRVSEAAVVGAPDERLGEVPVAFYVGDASRDELEDLCRQNLVPYKIPVSFHRVQRLPRNEVGKVVRKELLDHLRLPSDSPLEGEHSER
jgi:acyl-CoA synthetase (AMP-forming)/AMP-acid ligase II